jgi:hypothetical protein
MSEASRMNGGINIRELFVSLLINVGIPLLLFEILTNSVHMTEVNTLLIAAIVPALSTIIELVRNRRLDLIALFYLLGTLTSVVAVFMGGDARLLLIRESLFTGMLGVVCFISLFCFPRPLMFYVGRQMVAGKDAAKIESYNKTWLNLHIRATHRSITTVWGCALLGEFLLRTLIAYTLPTAVALTLGSTIFIVMIVATLAWTFAYGRRQSRRFSSAA